MKIYHAIIFLQGGCAWTKSGSTPEEALGKLEKYSQLKLTYRPQDGMIYTDLPHYPCGIIYQKGIHD